MSTNKILSIGGKQQVIFFFSFPALNTVKYDRNTAALSDCLHTKENNMHGNKYIPNCKAPLI